MRSLRLGCAPLGYPTLSHSVFHPFPGGRPPRAGVGHSLRAAASRVASAAIAWLGDSYSSGEGAGPFERATEVHGGNGCHRSAKAWPPPARRPSQNHFACSGATTTDFYQGKKSGTLAAPDNTGQLDRLHTLAGRELISKVYVTIGGNDLGFSRSCAPASSTTACAAWTARSCRSSTTRWPAVAKALAETKSAAAGGKVVMVGYPNLIPGRAPIRQLRLATREEKPRVWRLEDELDSALAGAARARGVTYVSILDALKGHESFCTKDSWYYRSPASRDAHHHVRQPAAGAPKRTRPEGDRRRCAAPRTPAPGCPPPQPAALRPTTSPRSSTTPTR